MDETDFWDSGITAETLRDIQAAWDTKLLRLRHPYVFDLIRVLAPYRRLKRKFALDADVAD